MDKEYFNGLGLAYLILIAGVVIWFGVLHTKTFNREFIQEKRDRITEIVNLKEENALLILENQRLKKEIENYNNLHFHFEQK